MKEIQAGDTVMPRTGSLPIRNSGGMVTITTNGKFTVHLTFGTMLKLREVEGNYCKKDFRVSEVLEGEVSVQSSNAFKQTNTPALFRAMRDECFSNEGLDTPERKTFKKRMERIFGQDLLWRDGTLRFASNGSVVSPQELKSIATRKWG